MSTSMPFSCDLLSGKTIMITGAGKGIGKACAVLAHACGANVIATARTQSDLDALQAQYSERMQTWACDVADPAFHARIRQLDELHGLINNAGTNKVAPMIDQSDDNIATVINLNITALYKVSQAALHPMMKSGSASIVNMSSQMGFVGSPLRTLYCMSKHAVEGLSKAMAVELAEQHIRVNTVAPTFVLTPMTQPMLDNPEFKAYVMSMLPMGKLAKVEDIANACAFLLSDAASMITGTSIKVDGGWTAR